jgi:phosphopantothenoylcysteine decarboxylase / phosphopantothenate---cysteine ligase
VHLVSADGVQSWPELSKQDVATRLVGEIARTLGRAA